jgi:D-mannonate dehydratase
VAEREYAVRVFDSAPGQGLTIEPVGNLQRAQRRIAYYQAINETRGTYGISAKAVYRYTFMPGMDWEEVAGA